MTDGDMKMEKLRPMPREEAVLAAIRSYIAAHGVAPTFDEITAAAGMKSKSNVHGYVVRLEQLGLIRRRPNRARQIELVERCPTCGRGGGTENGNRSGS